MGADLDTALVEKQKLIGIPNRAQPMGDYDAGSTFHQCAVLLDTQFSPGIYTAGCLIEDQDR